MNQTATLSTPQEQVDSLISQVRKTPSLPLSREQPTLAARLILVVPPVRIGGG